MISVAGEIVERAVAVRWPGVCACLLCSGLFRLSALFRTIGGSRVRLRAAASGSAQRPSLSVRPLSR